MLVGKHNEWHSVQASLIDAVLDAETWNDVRQATDALFHARLIYKRLVASTETGGCAAAPKPQPDITGKP